MSIHRLGICKRHIVTAALILIAGVAVWYALFASTWPRVIVGMLAAGLLFQLRRTHRAIYGLIECVAGVLALATPMARQTCGTFAESCQPVPMYVLMVTTLTGVYLIIRGLDNVEQGRKRRDS